LEKIDEEWEKEKTQPLNSPPFDIRQDSRALEAISPSIHICSAEKFLEFTLLESSAIHGVDDKNKTSIPHRKGGGKAPSFLTGFTTPPKILRKIKSIDKPSKFC